MAHPSRPPGGGEAFLLVRKIKLDPAVYRTDIPLIVHERCREPGPCHDGKTPESPKLLALWRALRWLMAAFPDRRAFSQLHMAKVAGIDQKSVQKWARKLVELGLFVEAGREVYKQLTGKNGEPKEQPFYTIPLDELEAESLKHAGTILRDWERRLFEGEPPAPAPEETQLALDLSDPPTDESPHPSTDQSSHPPTDQSDLSDPPTDESPHPPTDQAHPPTDESSDPPTDEGPDPPTDEHGRKEGRKEGSADALTRDEPDSRTLPATPPDEAPLALPPLGLWAMFVPAVNPVADRILLGRLAASHDATTGGHGWYWIGRAIVEVQLGGGANNWLAAVRATLRRWQETASYGSDAPRAARAPRTRAVGATLPTPAGEKLSDWPILNSPLAGHRKAYHQRKFAAAPDRAAKLAVLAEAAREIQETPDDPANPAV